MKFRQQGVGLIELMVTIVIGMVIMSGLVAIATATFGANATQMRSAQLNYELRNVADTIARDLRRAAYNGTQAAPANESVGVVTVGAGGNSITFPYLENDGDGAQRSYTYALGNVGGAGVVTLQIDAGAAQPLTDNQRVNITNFLVETVDTYQAGDCGGFFVNSRVYRITVRGTLRQDANTVRRVVEEVRPRNQQITQAPACPT